MPSPTHAVILAAGRGTRMKSARPKVLHEVLGRPLLECALRIAESQGCDPITVVVGHGAGGVAERFAGRAGFVTQDPPLGTGDALRAARQRIADAGPGTVLVMNADMPLLREGTVSALLASHAGSGAALTLLTARPGDPAAYGRVIRDASGAVRRIVETRDATPEELAASEVNAGLYAFAAEALLPALERLSADNRQGEYDLTDCVALLVAGGARVEGVVAADSDEILGVNDQAERARAVELLRRRRLAELMAGGVAVEDPASTWVDADTTVAADALIRPFTFLEGRTSVAAGAEVGPACRLRNVAVGAGARILDHCVLVDSAVGPGATVGPFAHLRPGSRLGARSKVGNFVELKNTGLGEGSKASHLSYLGDAEIGRSVNIGAGTITCNYDGIAKHRTEIGDGAFIGSDAVLVAPISVGAGAYVAAGSAITEDVEPDALALGRARQVVKPGWARRRRGDD